MASTIATSSFPTAISAGLKPLLLLVGLAAAVAAGVGITLWSKGPTYSTLYATLSDEEAAAVTKSLGAAGIAYRLEAGTGGLSVPAEKLSEARMLLAEQGTLSSGGFANLSKETGFGLSQFMEGARYQHALELELAKTISSLQQVAAARVHIATARNSTFIKDRSPGRASVFVQLKSGRRLSSEQVTAIVNLVGSAVPDIDASQITVVDQSGRLLSSPQGRDEFALRDQQIEFARQMEEMYAQRVEALISPLVGFGRVKAQVSAQFDMSAKEEAREQFTPESAVMRSEQLSEERNGQNLNAVGVPGSASNQPISNPQAAAAAAAAQAAGGAATPGQAGGTTPAQTPGAIMAGGATTAVQGANAAVTPPTSMQSTRNFEIDRTVAYTRQPAGRLQRLSVAVLVDNVQVAGRDGQMTDAPLSREQIDRITLLVKDAVGFDAARGDSVSVVNSAWRGEPRIDDGELASVAFWERPWFLDALKIIAGLAALAVLTLFVVKPLTQRFTELMASAPTQPVEDEDFNSPMRSSLPVAASSGGELAAPTQGNEVAVAQRKRKPISKYDEHLNAARALVDEDPARVAQVVRKWAMSNG